jgi:hydrogenase-4 component E
MNIFIETVLLILVISNLLLLGFSQIKSCIRAVAVQGIALGTLPLLVYQESGLTVGALLLSVITIGLKGVVFPRLLLRFLREADIRHEVEPYVGHIASTLVGFLFLGVSVWLCSRLPSFLDAPSLLVAPVSFFVIFVGLFIIISRKKAISQILGYLVMENGMYLFGVVMLREMPLLVDLGVLLDAFAAVFVMGIAVYHINREFDHIDVDQLDILKG